LIIADKASEADNNAADKGKPTSVCNRKSSCIQISL